MKLVIKEQALGYQIRQRGDRIDRVPQPSRAIAVSLPRLGPLPRLGSLTNLNPRSQGTLESFHQKRSNALSLTYHSIRRGATGTRRGVE